MSTIASRKQVGSVLNVERMLSSAPLAQDIHVNNSILKMDYYSDIQ